MSKKIKYNIWTSGCQMNKSDSEMLAGQFESLGIIPDESFENADMPKAEVRPRH